MTKRETYANLVLAAALVAVAGMVAGLFVRRAAQSPGTLRLAIAVGGAAALLLVLGLATRRPWKVNLALAVAALGLSLVVAELALTILERRGAAAATSEAVERSRFDLVRDLRRRGVEAYAVIGPNQFLDAELDGGGAPLLPLAGISASETVFCDEGGGFVRYRSDEHGFRNPGPGWPGRAPIVLLGDSFAHGACVGEGAGVAGRLRAGGAEVVNLGMAGSGPLIQLAIYREYGEPLRPEIVFWLYYEGNDLNDLHREAGAAALRRYLDAEGYSQRLRGRQPEIDAALRAHFERALETEAAHRRQGPPRLAARLARTAGGVARLRAIRRRLSTLRTADSWRVYRPLFERALIEVRERVDRHGGRLVFVYLPARARYDSAVVAASYRHDGVVAAVEALGIPVVDLVPVFARAGDPTAHFAPGGNTHYDDSGYAAVATELRRYLAAHPPGAGRRAG